MMTVESKCAVCDTVLPPGMPPGQCVGCALRLVLGPDPTPAGAPGERSLGPYTLLERLGEGGMGVVWKARHQRLNKLVAIKWIKAGFLASPAEIDRFRSEMEVVACLDHPNIVPVYDAGEDEGQVYCAMRLLEGGSLAGRLYPGKAPDPAAKLGDSTDETGPGPGHGPALDPAEAARLVATVARAVHHAHQRGILHRDLKPSNILLDAKGEPHLADFGLARRLDGPAPESVTGAIVGSVHYLAPEQIVAARRQPLSTAVDVHGLGMILYELLAGRPPFTADSIPGLLRRIVEEDPVPPLSRGASGVAPDTGAPASQARGSAAPPPPGPPRWKHRRRAADLEIVCLKCLAKDPERRYGSAADLADDLERWLRREPIEARPPGRWERAMNAIRRHPVRAGFAALGLLTLLLALTFALASLQTYHWLLGKIADEHLISPPDEDGVFRLQLSDEKGERCTYNFWKLPFGSYGSREPWSRLARLEFHGLPAAVANSLQVQVFGDVPGFADRARTPILTNGAIFELDIGLRRERAYYFAEKNFRTRKIIAQHPDAAIHVVLLGRAGRPDSHEPAGRLSPRERP